MTYESALRVIHGHSSLKYTPSLSRMTRLMSLLGNPQDELKFIHVSGTNGKGSVCAYFNNIFIESGYKTGLYTSPFLESFTERIQINNQPISEDFIAEYTEKIENVIIENNLECNEFEFITALSFCCFYQNKCDIVVLETGLGGEFDSTNIIKNPLLCVLTSVSLDHINVLGKTVKEIARVKARTAKKGCPFLTRSDLPVDALSVITETVKEKSATLFIADSSKIHTVETTRTGCRIICNGEEYHLSMIGKGQLGNLALVIRGIEILNESVMNISLQTMKRAVEKTVMPARLEKFSCDGRNVILDGSHNTESILNGVSALREHGFKLPVTLIYASMSDKSYRENLKILSEISDVFIFTQTDLSRSLSAKDLKISAEKAGIESEIFENPISAFERALAVTQKEDTIFICGSFYLAGEIRKKLH